MPMFSSTLVAVAALIGCNMQRPQHRRLAHKGGGEKVAGRKCGALHVSSQAGQSAPSTGADVLVPTAAQQGSWDFCAVSGLAALYSIHANGRRRSYQRLVSGFGWLRACIQALL